MMKLVVKNSGLFAVTASGEFIGKIINNYGGQGGDCIVNPPYEEPGAFAHIFRGHGYIYHQDDNPPNPFFNRSWGEVFENPELLPEGTKNVFVDQGSNVALEFRNEG